MTAALTDRRPALPLTRQEVDALRRSMHAGKVAYATHHAAHAASERLRSHGIDDGTAYRCLFATGLPGEAPHWHVGHAPAMADLARIARYLRFGAK